MQREKFVMPPTEKPKLTPTQERLEKLFDLKKQYQEQFVALKDTGVIELLPETGKYGVYDINGKECPIPSYDEILARMSSDPEKVEMLEKKREQGFTELLLVPIGMKLSEMVYCAEKLIVKKHKEGNLLGTDGKKLELDEENQPVYVSDEYQDADVKGELVYGVKKFDKVNHGGQTKQELLADKDNPHPGWQIMFIEDLPDLPAKGKGKEIKGRKQFKTDQSLEEYLDKIQTDPQYANEQFTMPEAQLIYFIEYLQRHNQVIDDYEGKGKICWNAGAYFKGSGLVPNGVWSRVYGRFDLSGENPAHRNIGYGVRSSVSLR